MHIDEAGVEPCNQSDWWAGAPEEDALSLPLDGDDDAAALWSGAFVPPPPRPHFLDDSAAPDGLTTCDLCAWAWRARTPVFPADEPPDNETKLGWLLTLAIVSIVSAAVGAVVMVTVLHCRNRLKNLRFGGVCSSRSSQRARAPAPAAPAAAGAELATRPSPGKVAPCERERACRENHYTLHEDAVYAELDRDSTAFHNGAYTGSDTEPSSAYYSDLSAADRDRPYEAVAWEGQPSRPALSAITETLTVPSDYV
ncbi:uncharacterized protein LOC124795038 [Schistocerca piceifrons]|uniref:uncharacterized protein LOC124795038 n=1 Tax=Schistocerca piceifrons TaxID=274613 RepID=UPI001F5FA1E2|nr:uncharacterized protein LOC124795038 [Schistocerca piceifrons]